MELTPPSGRPPKAPEERRSETVHIRMCPSHKELIELEADWRSVTMTSVVVRIGFEEIQPGGRHLPEPVIWEELLDLADQLRTDAGKEPPPWNGDVDYDLSYDLRSVVNDFQQRADLQLRNREELWEAAEEETRDEILGVRLTPKRYRWLGQRAREQETSRSSLLRARALEGIRNRCQLPEMYVQIEEWTKTAKDLRISLLVEGAEKELETWPGLEEAEARSRLRALAQEIETAVARWRKKR